jgi:phosphatidate phosphatase APP1
MRRLNPGLLIIVSSLLAIASISSNAQAPDTNTPALESAYSLKAADTGDLELPYSEIAADEVVVFFRTTAWLDAATDSWHVPIHGWIYEPEDSQSRKAIFSVLLEEEFDLAPTKATSANFSRRLNLLIADNERGKHIVISIAGEQHTLPASGVNGHFESTLTIAAATLAEHIEDSSIQYSAVTMSSDTRVFVGTVRLVSPSGLSVISDIDDTVKISHVTNKKSLLNHTFFLDFAAAPGMASLYAEWADQGVEFHYVSSSPWQLYSPLQEFLAAAGFPDSALNLKAVRFRDASLMDLFKKGTETKPVVIEEILTAYPSRYFVLVGDSGEQDPEVYAALLRKYSQQILKIYIRNVSGETANNDRFKSVFENIDSSYWALFDDPQNLKLPQAPISEEISSAL